MIVTAVPEPPTIALGVKVITGRSEFAAETGLAMGTRKSIPEIARIAKIIPELNFIGYAFVGVFILFSDTAPLNEYLSNMDESSILCSICCFRRK